MAACLKNGASYTNQIIKESLTKKKANISEESQNYQWQIATAVIVIEQSFRLDNFPTD